MGLEKSTYVATQTSGRLEFKHEGDHLKIEILNGDMVVIDTATISGEDPRSLVKDFFPTKRPKKVKAATERKKAA